MQWPSNNEMANGALLIFVSLAETGQPNRLAASSNIQQLIAGLAGAMAGESGNGGWLKAYRQRMSLSSKRKLAAGGQRTALPAMQLANGVIQWRRINISSRRDSAWRHLAQRIHQM